MPPKRKGPAPPSAAGPSKAKKSKSNANANANDSDDENDEQFKAILKERASRWSTYSGSKNLDAEYIKTSRNSEDAYEFHCICNPIKDNLGVEDEDSEDDEDKDEEENQDDEPKKTKCDQGKTCPCHKDPSELPDHPYTISKAGVARQNCAANMMNLRNPDFFAMYTFNDHEAYGSLEVVQNLMLDFDEAMKAKNYREAWAVIEALGLFIRIGGGDTMFLADDGEMISKTAGQIARAVLAALAALEDEKMLDSIKNAGWMIGVWIDIAKMFRDGDLIDDSHVSKAKTFKFSADNFGLYLREIAYRLQLKIPKIENTTKEITMPKEDAKDPWGWTRTFAEYKRGTIGGDALDISSWTSAQRKEKSFDKKDPLPKEAQANLKKGLVLVLG